jgi:hypothetical protein
LLGKDTDPRGRIQRQPVENRDRLRRFDWQRFSARTQTKYNFVPEQTTDFIFCTVGEESLWQLDRDSTFCILVVQACEDGWATRSIQQDMAMG